MNSDLKLDLDLESSAFNDLAMVNGDLVLTGDKEGIKQNVLQRLRMFFSEWFMDLSLGIPYYQQILVKNPDQGGIDALFVNAIINTPGITALTNYSFALDRATRVLSISFKALTTDGPVSYNGSIPT